MGSDHVRGRDDVPTDDTAHGTRARSATHRDGTTEQLRLFVYGTLKRGQIAHDRFCSTIVAAEEATVRGKLYLHAAGYPVLEVRERDVLAGGSSDARADARLTLTCATTATESTSNDTAAESSGWDRIHGELLTLADPVTTLPAIDDFEDFAPAASSSLYRRVLLSVQAAAPALAWTYVAGAGCALATMPRIRGGRWP